MAGPPSMYCIGRVCHALADSVSLDPVALKTATLPLWVTPTISGTLSPVRSATASWEREASPAVMLNQVEQSEPLIATRAELSPLTKRISGFPSPLRSATTGVIITLPPVQEQWNTGALSAEAAKGLTPTLQVESCCASWAPQGKQVPLTQRVSLMQAPSSLHGACLRMQRPMWHQWPDLQTTLSQAEASTAGPKSLI